MLNKIKEKEECTVKKESEKKMEYDLEEKFSPIVERIHELAKEFHTSKKFYFYDSGTGKVIECGEVIYCCMKSFRCGIYR